MKLSQIHFGLCAGLLIALIGGLFAQQGLIGWTLALVGAAVFAANSTAWCYLKFNRPALPLPTSVFSLPVQK